MMILHTCYNWNWCKNKRGWKRNRDIDEWYGFGCLANAALFFSNEFYLTVDCVLLLWLSKKEYVKNQDESVHFPKQETIFIWKFNVNPMPGLSTLSSSSFLHFLRKNGYNMKRNKSNKLRTYPNGESDFQRFKWFVKRLQEWKTFRIPILTSPNFKSKKNLSNQSIYWWFDKIKEVRATEFGVRNQEPGKMIEY